MTDDYGVDGLIAKFNEFPHAKRLLEQERRLNPDGKIDIERLMTRLDGRMPYGFERGFGEVLGLLLFEVKQSLVQRLEAAKQEPRDTEVLAGFSRVCVNNRITCVTFNYDDAFDEALFNVAASYDPPPTLPNWHPDGGYGFFCRPSLLGVEWAPVSMGISSMQLLKLHGSINWRPRRGASRPYSIEAIAHHEEWYRPPGSPEQVSLKTVALHLEPEPFIVPPVLVKSALVEQPVLRIVWTLAYEALQQAEQVAFVGYSLPVTDIGASFLFREALEKLDQTRIRVVNLPKDDAAESAKLMDAYRGVFPGIADAQFEFRDALEWARGFVTPAAEVKESSQ